MPLEESNVTPSLTQLRQLRAYLVRFRLRAEGANLWIGRPRQAVSDDGDVVAHCVEDVLECFVDLYIGCDPFFTKESRDPDIRGWPVFWDEEIGRILMGIS